MIKQYKILKINTKEMEVPDGYHTTTVFSHKLVEMGYSNTFDTLEEAEEALGGIINKFDNYTIIPFYTYD